MFLLGDAGHIHSPVGTQGMNTGIRLPWVEARETAAGGGADNFAPLASLDWQVQ
ncbi:MAG TPA: FAD-dependent monooxygenase, partial [Thermoanaerobaculia bacterium]|nr:FAD-dependent monooxygenase [Thermoanaerobaculia bacterium]